MQTCLSGAVLRGFGLGQRALYFSQALVAIEHVIHGQAFECVDLLAHVRDTPVGGQQAVAGIRRQLSPQQGKQAGFTGAIGTDQTGFMAGVQSQLGVF
ncbi:hypothetical protein ALQ20_200010 [Pseudomonas syringae pv. atrofaciens]|nr:hypothetical protein ALQ20_200010 [Pseudomonas syringae pv. atrofaciens]